MSFGKWGRAINSILYARIGPAINNGCKFALAYHVYRNAYDAGVTPAEFVSDNWGDWDAGTLELLCEKLP